MKPIIDHTKFGSITIEGKEYDHDVWITPKGEIKKRKKKLSKEVYGTSHIISLDEAEKIYQADATQLIIGTGQTGYVELSDEAQKFFDEKECEVALFPTPKALKVWNETDQRSIGLFHVTC